MTDTHVNEDGALSLLSSSTTTTTTIVDIVSTRHASLVSSSLSSSTTDNRKTAVNYNTTLTTDPSSVPVHDTLVSEPKQPVTTLPTAANTREQRLTNGNWPNVLDNLSIVVEEKNNSSNPSSSHLLPLNNDTSSYHLMDRQTILKRIWDTGTISMYACTWNMHGKPVPDDLSPLIPSNNRYLLYAFGSEECGAGITASILSPTGNVGKEKWENRLQTELGNQYVRISSVSMGAIHLVIFVHEAIFPIISDIQTGIVPTGIGNTLGNKGGIGIGFNLGKTALLCINCHFAAHQNAIRRRNADYQRIEEIMPLVPNGYNTEARIQLQQQLQAQQKELIHQQELQVQLRTHSRATLTSPMAKTSPSPKKSFISLLPIKSTPKVTVDSPSANTETLPGTIESLNEDSDDGESDDDDDDEEEEDKVGSESSTKGNEEGTTMKDNDVVNVSDTTEIPVKNTSNVNIPREQIIPRTPSPSVPSSETNSSLPAIVISTSSSIVPDDSHGTTVHNRSISSIPPNVQSSIGTIAPSTVPNPTSGANSTAIPSYVSDRYDRVIWMGDMNYRINGNRTVVDLLLSTNRHEVLLANDQLLRERNQKRIFNGFEEGPLNFRPTYKYDSKSDNYDTGPKQRIPAWTDRILYKTKMDTSLYTTGSMGTINPSSNPMKIQRYISIDSIKTSDHRPVVAVFDLKLRGGHNRGRGSITSVGSHGTSLSFVKSETITPSPLSSSSSLVPKNNSTTLQTTNTAGATFSSSSSSSASIISSSHRDSSVNTSSRPHHSKNNKVVPVDANGQPVPFSTIPKPTSGCVIM